MVKLQKIDTAFLEERSDTKLYQIHSQSPENRHFRVVATFSNGIHWPSWIAQSHKFEKTPSADHSG